MEALRQHFRPEFLNRVDEIVIFQPLGTRAASRRSSTSSSRDLGKRLAERKIDARADAGGARGCSPKQGYDPTFGARPLKRTIQRHDSEPAGAGRARGRFAEGDTVVVDADGGGETLRFRKQSPAAVAS